MLGSGIFVLPGLAFSITGESVWLSYLLAAICVLPAAISKSELATAMPSSGGTYIYLDRTFGPMAGTIAGLGLWISLLLKSAFALMGFGAYLNILSNVNIKEVALVLAIAITFINIFGVGKISNFLIFIVITAISSLVLLDTLVILNPLEVSGDTAFLQNGIEGLIKSTGLVFVSFAGVTKVAAIAEEIKKPEKNLPRGILISLLIVTIVYCTTTFALSKYVELSKLSGNLRPIYTMTKAYAGDYIGIAISVIAIITMTSMANAGLLAASRFPFAMSRDGLLPKSFGKLHINFKTPIVSIISSGIIILFIISFIDITKIAKLASAFILAIYLFENIAVIILRETRVHWYRPTYKSILYPFTQMIGITLTSFLLLKMGSVAIVGLLGISIPGLIIYFSYARKRVDRKGVIGIHGKRKDLTKQRDDEINKMESATFNRDAQIVITLLGKERSPEMLVEMGVALSENDDLIEVAHLTEAPEQSDLSDFIEEPPELKSLRRRVIAMAIEKGKPLTFDPVVTHDISKTIFELSQRMHSKWLFMEWSGKSRGTITLHSPITWLKAHLECHLVIFKDKGVRYIRKILVVLNLDHNDEIIISTAEALAVTNKAEIAFAYFVNKNEAIERCQSIEHELEIRTNDVRVRKSIIILTGKNSVSTIVQNSAEFDLLIIGSEKNYRWHDIFSSVEDQIIDQATCSVISIHPSGKGINK
ncbi:amino acid permease [Bacteriovorax sp. Seq25_V]|nr:amino acid permease [Bacteriovorax sp. Seq25_V]